MTPAPRTKTRAIETTRLRHGASRLVLSLVREPDGYNTLAKLVHAGLAPKRAMRLERALDDEANARARYAAMIDEALGKGWRGRVARCGANDFDAIPQPPAEAPEESSAGADHELTERDGSR